MFRNLRADEIDVRIGTIKDKTDARQGYSLLLYKDARCDMSILDETVGAFNWNREHKELKGVIYCGVTITGSDGKSATKWDAGSESNTEAEKGESSDSFKRACVNWGIGRELYSAPFIWVKGYDKFERFKVVKIDYSGKHITAIEIADSKGKIAYRLNNGRTAPSQSKGDTTGQAKTITADQARIIEGLIKETGADPLAFCRHYKILTPDKLNADKFVEAVKLLERKRGNTATVSEEDLPEAMR